ncbi:hypothetical protein [Nonomuraea sp. NPDC003201]
MPLQHPHAVPERRKPAFSRGDIAAITAYVASLGSGPPIPTVGKGDPRRGRTPYLASCASCHSSAQ